jgi:DNA-binding response OmpR family regulator
MPHPRVLVVTDDAETTELIRGTLTAERYDVDTAGRAADALERFTQQHYDLLISSVRLPDVGGRELYWALRTRWRSASPRIIFLIQTGAPIQPRAAGAHGVRGADPPGAIHARGAARRGPSTLGVP